MEGNLGFQVGTLTGMFLFSIIAEWIVLDDDGTEGLSLKWRCEKGYFGKFVFSYSFVVAVSYILISWLSWQNHATLLLLGLGVFLSVFLARALLWFYGNRLYGKYNERNIEILNYEVGPYVISSPRLRSYSEVSLKFLLYNGLLVLGCSLLVLVSEEFRFSGWIFLSPGIIALVIFLGFTFFEGFRSRWKLGVVGLMNCGASYFLLKLV